VAIERFLGRTIPRVLLPDFDYKMRPRELAVSVRSEPARKGTGGQRHRGPSSSRAQQHGPSRNGPSSRRGNAHGSGQHHGSSHQGGGGASQDSSSQSFGRKPKRVRGIDRRRGRL